MTATTLISLAKKLTHRNAANAGNFSLFRFVYQKLAVFFGNVLDTLKFFEAVTLSSSSDRWSCDLNGEGTFRVKDIRAFNSESNPLERKDAEGPSLDEIGFCVRRMLVGVESDSCGLFRSEIRDVMVMYNAGVLRIDGKRIWKMITGEILGVHSQGDCVYVTTVTK
ncbi:hypothetical protein Tco_0574971 [Tanacetum coccineum]